jgi:hypothetical protein
MHGDRCVRLNDLGVRLNYFNDGRGAGNNPCKWIFFRPIRQGSVEVKGGAALFDCEL